MSFRLHVLGICKLHFIPTKLTPGSARMHELHLCHLKLVGPGWCSVRMEKARGKELAFYVPSLFLLKLFVYGALIISNLHLHVMLPLVTLLKISVNEKENKYIKQSLTNRIDV